MTIKEIREKAWLSRAEFCRRYNIPARTVEDWESGKRTPPEYVVELLEKAVTADLKAEAEMIETFHIVGEQRDEKGNLTYKMIFDEDSPVGMGMNKSYFERFLGHDRERVEINFIDSFRDNDNVVCESNNGELYAVLYYDKKPLIWQRVELVSDK